MDSVDLSPLLLGTLTPEGGLRHELVIGAGPRESNLSSAPACSSYAGVPLYDESEGSSAWSDVSGRAGNCSTVVGLIIDEGKGGLWKLLLGDEQQYSWTGPHYPNKTTNFDSQDPIYTKHCGNGCLL